jgi:hypothetical protein
MHPTHFVVKTSKPIFSKKSTAHSAGEKEGKRGKEEKKGKESWLGQNDNPETDGVDDAISPPPEARRRTAVPRIEDPRPTTQEFEFGLFIVNLHHFLKKSLLVIIEFYCRIKYARMIIILESRL